MFRSLRMRLVASYVSAAILLVLVAAFAVTAFALSMFGLAAKETTDAVARTAPDEVKLELARHKTLQAAAPDIVRHLARPGLYIWVSATAKDNSRRLLASGGLEGPDGRLNVFVPGKGKQARFGPFPPADGPRPPLSADGGGPGPERGPGGPDGRFWRGAGPGGPGGPGGPDRFGGIPLPLNFFMHLERKGVEVPGGHITIVPVVTQLGRFVQSFWIAVVPIGLFVVLAAWFAGRYIAGQALRPLVETTAALKRFAAGDFTPREIVTADRSEIGELVTAYNGAVAQVSAAFEERRNAEAQMRQFVADAGHELRTPLTVIMGFIDVLRRRGASEATASARIFDTMQAESRRMRALIDKLISLARLENPQREPGSVELGAIAQRVVDAQQALLSKPRLALHAERNVVVRADEYELHEAIANLVDNALKYAPSSPVEIDVRGEGDRAVVEVRDRGPGLSDEDQRHIFDRFYRGANRGETEGFGLGLAIVKRAVERAGGEVTVASTEGGGSRFAIRLPRAKRGDEARIAV